jgi:hypothetical protein
MDEVLFVFRRVVRPVAAAEVEVVFAVRVEGVEVPAACGPGVGEPYYVQDFAGEGGEGVGLGVPCCGGGVLEGRGAGRGVEVEGY